MKIKHSLLFGFLFCFFSISLFSQHPGGPFVDAGIDKVIPCGGNGCVELTATYLDAGQTDQYVVESIDYAPPFPFTGLANPVSVNTDDVWSAPVNLPFDFCFFGINNTKVHVGSNGIVSFNNHTTGGFCSYTLPNTEIPTTSFHPNAIMLFHDINPLYGGEIGWEMTGDYPNRMLVVSFANVPYYNFANPTNAARSTFQMVLYETTNVIDFYIKDKPNPHNYLSSPINGGRAVLGIQSNTNPPQGMAPLGRNTGVWAAHNEAWRFRPSGDSMVHVEWLNPNGDIISSTDTVEVCEEGTYTVRAIYERCDGTSVVVEDEVNITNAAPYSINLGEDIQTCILEEIILEAGEGVPPGALYEWFYNGVSQGPPAIDNSTFTVIPPNSGTYSVSVTNPADDCEVIDEIEVSFEDLILPEFTINNSYCVGEEADTLDLISNNGFSGTWSPAVIDTSEVGTFIYTFTSDDECALDATIEVVINEEVIPEFNNLQNVYCQFDDVAELPNLSDNGYNGTWSPALIDSSTPGTYTYTFTPDVPDCFQAFSVDIVIEETIIPTFNPVPPLCQFETGAVLPSPIEGVNGTWFPAAIDTSTPGIYEYTFTPEGQCSEAVTIEIEITEEIVPEFNLPNTYCQGEDPIALESISDNGVNGTWFPATIDTSTPGTFTYTFTPQGSLCANEINLVVQIQETPSLNSLPAQFLCDEDFDGIYETNLNDLSPSLGGGSNVNYTYYASMADLNSGISIPGGQLNNYQFDALPATIYVVGTSLHGCESQAVPIVFNEANSVQHNPGPFTPLDFCPEDAVDITQYETMISSAMGVDFEYYPTFNDARNQTSMITDPENFVPGNNQTSIFVRLNAAGACSAIVELQLNKLPSPVLELMNQAVICPGTDLEVTATSDMDNVTFVWTLPDGSEWNGASQVITEAGTYSVTAYSADGCRSETRTLTVKNPTTPTIVSVDISGNSIVVGASNNGEGQMEYSLDGVFWQSNNRFDNLTPGETYTVYVRSAGCMVSSYEVTVIFFPNFLSPNDDGVNDTWAIRGIDSNSGATIKIFDRYGKIFVDTVFQGDYEWNGKYMGRSVASGDYWYIINAPGDGVVPDRKFTGHVTVRN